MASRQTLRHAPDLGLVIVVLTLTVLGLLMVFSSSMSEKAPDTTFFLVQQLQGFVLGLIAMVAAFMLDYRTWRKFAYPAFILAIALLTLTLFVGNDVNGSRRTMPYLPFQPSEFAKVAVILFCAEWLPRKGDDVRTLGYGLLPFGLLMGVVVALVLREPDLGTSAVILFTAAALFLVAGAQLLQFFVAAGLAGFVVALTASRYQIERMGVGFRYWNPCAEGNTRLEQICHGIVAMGSGGLTGLGLGSSRWRWVLPAPYSDSIMAIIGEELGILGTIGVVLLFAFLVYRGFRVALRTPDSFGRLMAMGITLWLVVQASINIGGNVALLPFTGVPLPFISFGRSALVFTMFAVGILLNISRQTQETASIPHGSLQGIPHAPVDHGRGDRGARLPGSFRRGGAREGVTDI
jgi:cell division protein FtsW (lipid II flippase)